MRIYDFIKPELDYFRQTCNFSEDELAYLNYKAKRFTNQEIAIKLKVSEAKVSTLARRVKSKIEKAQRMKNKE